LAPLPPAAPPTAAHDPLDVGYVRSFVERVMGPIARTWFRVRVVGAHRIPARGPVILAANHSGNAFPYDGILLDGTLWARDGCVPSRKLRTVYEPELSYVWWMRPFGLDDFWRRGGGVDMTFDNFERLLERGDRVLYFPEGVPGIGKGFNRRYRLQHFRTSFVLLAARHHVPVLPLYIVNAEWVHPFGYVFPPLDRLMRRVFHVPFLPLPLGLLAIVFPWIWYLAFPARLFFVVGQPVDVAAMLREEGLLDGADPDRPALSRVAARLRHAMQAELDALVARFGRSPYDARSLWRRLRAERDGRWRAIPLAWPITFLRHDRDRRRPPARNRLHAVLRDWDLLGFYLPFGWPLLSLTRALRRPPCGYRGVPRDEARRRQGVIPWRLSEVPLPARAPE
ncbi:MAG TPA: 1-acyl-sn-glycerol-3-phosphate acyltransferase, partial [Gemmatimonadaceae bacterium]